MTEQDVAGRAPAKAYCAAAGWISWMRIKPTVRRYVQAQRNIDIARRQDAGRGANQLILNVHFLIALGGAGDLPGGDGGAKGRQRIVGFALNA
jgi:hypothetical protein